MIQKFAGARKSWLWPESREITRSKGAKHWFRQVPLAIPAFVPIAPSAGIPMVLRPPALARSARWPAGPLARSPWCHQAGRTVPMFQWATVPPAGAAPVAAAAGPALGSGFDSTRVITGRSPMIAMEWCRRGPSSRAIRMCPCDRASMPWLSSGYGFNGQLLVPAGRRCHSNAGSMRPAPYLIYRRADNQQSADSKADWLCPPGRFPDQLIGAKPVPPGALSRRRICRSSDKQWRNDRYEECRSPY